MMKKILAFLMTVLIAGRAILPLGISAQEPPVDTVHEVITCSSTSYQDGAKYQGKKVAPHLNAASFATMETIACGGTHLDGEGDLVFSNYAALKISLNFDPNSKLIGNTDVRVSDDSCNWNDMNRKNQNRYDDSVNVTEKNISYGAISAVRTDNRGNTEKYAPIFATGQTSVELPVFNVDGDYTVYVFFETVKNGKCQNHILSFSFKIRSYVYLLDQHSGFQIKNSGISGTPVVLDTRNRDGVSVEIFRGENRLGTYEGAAILDGFILSDDGTYRFIVRNCGFICEVFYFTIDSESEDRKVFFDNLCREISQYSYEAEKYFSFTWHDDNPNPVLSAEYALIEDFEKEPAFTVYPKDMHLTEPGLYLVRVRFRTAEVIYYITLTAETAPSHNYEKLTAERFNTFKTKWWEVRDAALDRVLCFDYDTERDRAYNAAMTIANNTVQDGTGRYFFEGSWYTDRIELTAAMNRYVFSSNFKTVYYDPADYADNEESLRTFSEQAFESCIYLDDEFRFMSSHPSEVSVVTATDENGKVYPLTFGVPIAEQNLPDGAYTIVEIDKYGNSTTYTAYRDRSVPVVRISSSTKSAVLADGEVYVMDEFRIEEMKDAFDPWSVLKIVRDDDQVAYYIKDEYCGIVFQDNGTYTVSAYDRNGNRLECTIIVY